MRFATSIHCIDGRIQETIIRHVKENHPVDHVDIITEPGPCKILAENRDKVKIDSIFNRVNISVHQHRSRLIFVSGHHDCAGNPVDESIQREQVKKSIGLIERNYPGIRVIGLWIDSRWAANPV